MMKKQVFAAIGLNSMLLMLCLLSPLKSNAEVNVNIAIPLPGLAISAPPAMIVIPGTYVYYPPDVGADIFFYHGYWYRPYRGQWFISAGYNGPWGSVAVGKVPRVVRGLPPYYRRVPPGYERMPYGTVRGNWRTWEREQYWDRHERSRGYSEAHNWREHAGPGHGNERGGMRGRHGEE
jgi:hypothetical protein